MDFSRLFSKREPRIVVLEGARWRPVTASSVLDRALDKRDVRKQWDDPPRSEPGKTPAVVVPDDWPYPLPPTPPTNAERALAELPADDVVHLHALITRADAHGATTLTVELAGVVTDRLVADEVVPLLAQLDDADLAVAAAFATARRHPDGTWAAFVWL